MEQFILPTTFAWKDGAKPNEKTVVIEPCYFGYGTTLGNALRRVLLSSLTGAAATAVKIDGVSHEFSAVPGVREDAIEILLNVKQLRLKVFTDEPMRLVLQARGKREVTAADITRDAQVEIVNPELHIASLTSDDAEFRMEIFVRRGRGYSSTDSRPKEKQELGTMAMDAIFTPIRNVGFRVENMRVGEITNYDRLLLTVETDGTMSPEDAVLQAGQMLIDHFSLIVHPPVAGTESAPHALDSGTALPELGAEPGSSEDTSTNS
ncbi:DNA-directed RNA polymerase subunit alpha [Candidatus Uhrbacteria bacterium]|nr:DNA-directed RNA polymerase subunit alpha [Candidatus Uhrbacteria bacterium]